MRLRLASRSSARARLLADAGVPFEGVDAPVDEEAAKAALAAQGLGPRDLADALAELKALRGSQAAPGDLVLGADQTLEDAAGTRIDKVESRAEAAALLAALSGTTHRLHSAAVLARDGQPVWRHVESVRLAMRPLSPAFIEAYLDADWEQCRWCVGCYRIEGPGAQLFAAIEGSLFAVQGLPLLPLLDSLRAHAILAA